MLPNPLSMPKWPLTFYAWVYSLETLAIQPIQRQYAAGHNFIFNKSMPCQKANLEPIKALILRVITKINCYFIHALLQC